MTANARVNKFSFLSAYLGLVSQVDYGIGLILDELVDRGELDNTIIVFTADHGDYAGEFGLWSKLGGISTRAITRVPIIVRWPGHVVAGTVSHEIVESIDLFPTLCELAGVPKSSHLQGMSFTSLLVGEGSQSTRKSALTENALRKAIATKAWRYVANTGDQPDELYDQVNDPWEMCNLIDDPDYVDVAHSLLRQLFDRTVAARRPVTMFDHGQWRHQYDRDGRAPVSPDYRSTDIHD